MKVIGAVCMAILIVLAIRLQGQGSRQAKPGDASNTIGMEFAKIAPGEFMMGCSTADQLCNPDESPRHRVQITKGFEIGKHEVTQRQWLALMPANPSSSKGDNRPVETVSKLEAQDFIARLNAKNDGYRYRLPTEAEWEYAARAGMDAANSGPLDQVAWYAANSDDETHPVGQKKPNAWGLYDTSGNVREWVSDFYQGDYYANSPASDPTGPQLAAGGRGARGAGPNGPPFGPGGGPRGGFARGGRGGNPPQPPPPPPIVFPPDATQQQQIDLLRRQVEQLQQQVQQLRNELLSPPQGAPGFGPPQGPFVVGSDGSLIDPLDGLPTGLPVARGGGWDQGAAFQRVSARYSYYGPTLKVSDIGFRIVREPVVEAK